MLLPHVELALFKGLSFIYLMIGLAVVLRVFFECEVLFKNVRCPVRICTEFLNSFFDKDILEFLTS